MEKHEFQNFKLVCEKCIRAGRGDDKELTWQYSETNDWSVADIAHGFANAVVRGAVLYCKVCGPVHTSRTWGVFSNKEEEATVARRIVYHVWRDHKTELGLEAQGSGRHGARKLVDGAQSLVDTVTPYTSMAKEMVMDQLAPAYWQPSATARECHCCQESFNRDRSKHHCRACGHVVCETCSPHRVNVKGSEVRVCSSCHEQFNRRTLGPGPAEQLHRNVEEHGTTLTMWKAGAGVSSAVSYVGGAATGLVKEGARPEYWKPDHEITHCSVCTEAFGTELGMHHCRACGEGVCDGCSQNRCRLVHHGWRGEERVCDTCFAANLACREGLTPLGD